MIPDIVNLPKQPSFGPRNHGLKSAASHNTNLYLPPVTVNEYII